MPVPARAHDLYNHDTWRDMQGTQFAQFSAEILRRGAAAVLPQHLPDRWLDALLEEADLLAPGEDDMGDDCCAGLLGAVLVLVSAQRGDPPELEIAGTTLLEYLHCYIVALSAESVSRRTDIWVEPPTLANIFDAAREVRARRRGPAGPAPQPHGPPGRSAAPAHRALGRGMAGYVRRLSLMAGVVFQKWQ